MNGATPLPDGGTLVSEITGSWIDDIGPGGRLRWAIQAPVSYPSDPQPLPHGRILLADYARPGHVIIIDHRGHVLWRYGPASGPGELNHPSLAAAFTPGLIAVNDDYRHRVVFISIRTHKIVWQYGHTGVAGRAPGYLNTPDGMAFLSAHEIQHNPMLRRLAASAAFRPPAVVPSRREPLSLASPVRLAPFGLPTPVEREVAVSTPCRHRHRRGSRLSAAVHERRLPSRPAHRRAPQAGSRSRAVPRCSRCCDRRPALRLRRRRGHEQPGGAGVRSPDTSSGRRRTARTTALGRRGDRRPAEPFTSSGATTARHPGPRSTGPTTAFTSISSHGYPSAFAIRLSPRRTATCSSREVSPPTAPAPPCIGSIRTPDACRCSGICQECRPMRLQSWSAPGSMCWADRPPSRRESISPPRPSHRRTFALSTRTGQWRPGSQATFSAETCRGVSSAPSGRSQAPCHTRGSARSGERRSSCRAGLERRRCRGVSPEGTIRSYPRLR